MFVQVATLDVVNNSILYQAFTFSLQKNLGYALLLLGYLGWRISTAHIFMLACMYVYSLGHRKITTQILS